LLALLGGAIIVVVSRIRVKITPTCFGVNTPSLGSLQQHAVVQWLTYCATNRKVVRSIPDSVIEIFVETNLSANYDPGVDSASNRNEYQEYFLGVKVAGA
jgi:hypothetical protein